MDYLEKSRHLQLQLNELKSEIEVMKVEEKETEFDRIHNDLIDRGETKYITLVRVSLFCFWHRPPLKDPSCSYLGPMS